MFHIGEYVVVTLDAKGSEIVCRVVAEKGDYVEVGRADGWRYSAPIADVEAVYHR